jgi:hypothetical protein
MARLTYSRATDPEALARLRSTVLGIIERDDREAFNAMCCYGGWPMILVLEDINRERRDAELRRALAAMLPEAARPKEW